MMENKLIYIASPYTGDVEKNVAFAKAACRYAMEQGCTPVAVHLLYPQFLDDSNPQERAAGLAMGHQVLSVCHELWVCGNRITSGMETEIQEAKRMGIPVREITEEQILGGSVMSKKYGVWAVRSANSVCGAAESWCKHEGKPMEFESREQASEYAKSLNENLRTLNVHYYPKEMKPELALVSDMGMKM
ncbi:TPA_asm: hypothetical protein GYO68_11270 [Listeria monocytogenes]|nr:hypothetical protein [Listeria monocytogenes]EAE8610806.1 hypothetical protein [Listeria monocytogenes]EAF5298274.1 hypothetical protein [Listeria monocytogenes]EAF5299086.1 hypothetical protein [Listeria monocytogenes]EAF7849377.1 hypothetical protein [Listeria monocytogenes]